MRPVDIKWLLALTLLSVALLAVTGGFTSVIMPDTPSYLDPHSFPDALAQPRLPFYGLMVEAVDAGDHSFKAVAALQTAFFCAAVWWFVAELRYFGLSRPAALSTATALLFSNSLILIGRWVHPELPAIACGLLAFAGVVRLAGPKPRNWAAVLIFAGGGLAYLLRPSMLSLIFVLPFSYACLRALRGQRPLNGWVGAILLMTALPFLALASVRAVAVGDFNIVSFGGYQMSGMAGLMLSDDVVARLPPDVKPLATAVLAARKAAENSGGVIGVPRNSSDIRSFNSAALSYYDVFARTYDEVKQLARQQQRPGESWVDLNKRLMRFSLAVVRAAPIRYLAWIFGASKRLLGHAFIANLPMMIAAIVLIAAWLFRLLTRRPAHVSPIERLDMPVMLLLAASWLVATGALSVLVTFPAIRYIDTANLLLAPVAIYWAALMVAPRLAESRPVQASAPAVASESF
jgi:hypothetical protein